MDDRCFSVSGLNEYVERLMQRDVFLSNLMVEGEVSGCKRHSSGHVYFSLKDSYSIVRCVFFRQYTQNGGSELQDGVRVRVKGYASLYTRDGQFQVYVQGVERQGRGELYEEFERIKAELSALGYFEAERKRPIPAFAKKIGVVTSASGAAIHDIITVAKRRFEQVEILLYPVAVQGAGAEREIAQGILRMGQADIDVLIVGRGGGSMEDLWAFNHPDVAEAIFASPVPVISAVGHETDFTIADFTADLRAATPSAAAEIAVPNASEYRARLQRLGQRMQNICLQRVSQLRSECLEKKAVLAQAHPMRQLERYRHAVEQSRQALSRLVQAREEQARQQVNLYAQRLKSSDPTTVLKRGYALVQDAASGHIIYQVEALDVGQNIKLQFSRGGADARITGVNGEEHRL